MQPGPSEKASEHPCWGLLSPQHPASWLLTFFLLPQRFKSRIRAGRLPGGWPPPATGEKAWLPRVQGPKQGGSARAAALPFLGPPHAEARPAAPTPTPSPKPTDFPLTSPFWRPGPCRGRALAEEAVLRARPFRGGVSAGKHLLCSVLPAAQALGPTAPHICTTAAPGLSPPPWPPSTCRDPPPHQDGPHYPHRAFACCALSVDKDGHLCLPRNKHIVGALKTIKEGKGEEMLREARGLIQASPHVWPVPRGERPGRSGKWCSCVVPSRPPWLGSCYVKGEPEVKGHPEPTVRGGFLQLHLELALNPPWSG